MPTTLLSRPGQIDRPLVADTFDLEEKSPFGLQGLRRGGLRLLKTECIAKLAFRLAMRGGRKEVERDAAVDEVLQRHPEWMEEFEVVHLIEKSLWIQGRSDLVMTLEKNPSQIPDAPPREILDALTRANTLHPQGTIWFGVPLFGDQTTQEGLPIPLSAQEVREENRRRIRAARDRALRFGWLYKLALRAVGAPFVLRRMARVAWGRLKAEVDFTRRYVQQMRRDARERRWAQAVREMEYVRCGRALTPIPEPKTALGRVTGRVSDAAAIASRRMEAHGTLASAAHATLTMAQLLPMVFAPLAIASADPFLFVELPDEPGKLRHLGHWYWHGPVRGDQTLHLHV